MEIERNLFLDPGADPGFDPETAADEAFNDNELKELERLSNVKLSLISVETLVLFLKKKNVGIFLRCFSITISCQIK